MSPFIIDTEAGSFAARFSARGLCSLNFPDRPDANDSQGQPEVKPEAKWLAQTEKALQALLAGKAPDEMPPLDLSCGTAFQQKIWRAMLAIPLGQTLTYTEIARQIGHPNAVRAAGGACGANPIPVLVPCHRVLAAHGKLGGFSSGLPWKRFLLQREGVLPKELC